MGSRSFLGGFEQVVLLGLARREEGAYGGALHEEILAATGKDVSIPAIYVTLKRMEAKGLVRSAFADGVGTTARPKRVYHLLPAGREALVASRGMLDQLWERTDLPVHGESQ